MTVEWIEARKVEYLEMLYGMKLEKKRGIRLLESEDYIPEIKTTLCQMEQNNIEYSNI
jgi:hypothetical protein